MNTTCNLSDEESPPRPPEPKMEELTESDQGFSR